MIDVSAWDVYLVTDRGFSKGRSTMAIVEAAVSGGVSAVQLREKTLETRDFYDEGRKIREYLRSKGVPLIINDRIDIALALDADGVHVGQSDMAIDIARRLLGPDRIIGLSVGIPEHIDERALTYADYLGISPVFFTSTKPDEPREWEIEGVTRVRGMTSLPLVAIGSVKRSNAREVIIAGADCVAVVTAIVSENDPALATAALVAEVRSGKQARKNLKSAR
jgi:thiamine-phosphate pyrophosphorylase